MPEIEEINDESIQGDIVTLKDQGNEAFKELRLQQALDDYTHALQLAHHLDDKARRDIEVQLLRNRAIVYLKLEEYEKAERDCSSVLEKDSDDAKALYRRACAREALSNYGDAFLDAKRAYAKEPKNTACRQLCENLYKLNQKKQEEAHLTVNRAANMLKICFGTDEERRHIDDEKRENAFNNLIVLARESTAAADLLFKRENIIAQLIDTIRMDKQALVVVACLRVLDEFARHEDRAYTLLDKLGAENIVNCVNVRSKDVPESVEAGSSICQRIFNALGRMDKSKDIKPDVEWANSEKNKVHIIRLIIACEDALADKNYSAIAREAVVDLLIRNLTHMDGGLPRGWSWRFVEDRGLCKLLSLATEIPEACTVPVSSETRQHVSLCLSKLYEDMVFDDPRQKFKDVCKNFLDELMGQSHEPVIQVRICSLLITLMQGVYEVGFSLTFNDQVTTLMLEMASNAQPMSQKLAAELIVETTSKHDRAKSMIATGIPVLKKLFTSKDDGVKARALVGLCKCASAGGDDASKKLMADGSTIKLAQQCKRFIVDNNQSLETRRFAIEGLSYLSMDADVKEFIVEDMAFIRALVDVAKQCGSICVYSMASIFVNLTNAYKKPESDAQEQMKKLAEFAKHHVPQEHEKDAPKYVDKRAALLVKEGATAACVAVGTKTESKKCMELLARSLAKFTANSNHRGQVVAEGGAKLLLRLAHNADEEARRIAAQGLARLGITISSEIAFPGQRIYEVVRPLLDLLHPDCTALQNYEALLCLTNLAAQSDSVRQRVLKGGGVMNKIDEYWFMQEHPELRAAASELMLNLCHSEKGRQEILKEGTDRLKLSFLYASSDEDIDDDAVKSGRRLIRASAGALAILTQNDVKTCKRLVQTIEKWTDALKAMVQREDAEANYRSMIVVFNLMEQDLDICAQICQTQILEMLIATAKLQDKKRERSKNLAEECLRVAEQRGFIQATEREKFERRTQTTTVDANAIIVSTIKEESDED